MWDLDIRAELTDTEITNLSYGYHLETTEHWQKKKWESEN